MAERRMMSKAVIETDMFMDMPMSSQCLYFHLLLRADDDGFIKNPSAIRREVGCGEDDMKLLVAKQFILPFDTGVIVIRHWKIHNYIRKDMYHPTECQSEKSLLTGGADKTAYTPSEQAQMQGCNIVVTDTLQTCNNDVTGSSQVCNKPVSIGKVRLGKDNIYDDDDNARDTTKVVICQEKKYSKSKKISANADNDTDLAEVVSAFCDNLQPLAGNLVLERLTDAYDQYGKLWCLEAIKETALHNGRSIQYVVSVLEQWERDGFKAPLTKKKETAKNGTSGSSRRPDKEISQYAAYFDEVAPQT